jgi:hypothetical protein
VSIPRWIKVIVRDTLAPAPMDRRQYKRYLRSRHWQRVKRRELARAKHRCERCGTRRAQLEVHHRTYANVGHEQPGECEVLCQRCHANVHAGRVW